MAPNETSWPTWPEKAKSPETLFAYVQPAGRMSTRLTLSATVLLLVTVTVKRVVPPGHTEVGFALFTIETGMSGGGQALGPAASSERPSPSAPTNVFSEKMGGRLRPTMWTSRSVVPYWAALLVTATG